MRIGFLVWNQFQVAHAAEIAKHFDEPDFIFIDRTPAALKDFDPAWLVQYGAYARFVSELDLSSLDGQYDAIVSQFRPPLKSAWSKTRLIMQQYSLAKPKTAYNARWFASDLGLVYGAYSESIIGQMCPVSQVGNPRFDPYFSGTLLPDRVDRLRACLDPGKQTILYLPTWGDLSQAGSFGIALSQLSEQFNIIVRPHHLTSIRDRGRDVSVPGLIDVSALPRMLDPGLYLMAVADLVISDMSGAIFDALYCRKPVVLIGNQEADFSGHSKADDSALEVSQRDRIGPYVTHAEDLARAVCDQIAGHPYREENERLVSECFRQRGGGAGLAAASIRGAVENELKKPQLQVYAAPDFSSILLSRAAAAAEKRRKSKRRKAKRSANEKALPLPGRLSRWPVARPKESGKGAAESKRGASLSTMVRKGQFFAAGMKLEHWSKQGQLKRAQSIYQAQSAASALRLSRALWKRQVARLFEDAYPTSTESGRELLQQLGMLRSAAVLYSEDGLGIPGELFERLEHLGPLAGVLDLAARNEVAGPEDQSWFGPSGEVKRIVDSVPSPMVELHLLASLARDLRDEEQRPYRQSLFEFSRNLIRQLLAMGVAIQPRIQAGIVGATAISAEGNAFTWHTRDCGRPHHFHLKIGTLYGHFIMDDRGYSGWGSIAEAPLSELIADVSQDAADAHWEKLRQDLVLGEKSKYSQAEEALPEDWEDFIFLPMQVADDAVAQLARIDTLSLLNAVIEWGRSRGEKVVVKRHPMCRDEKIALAINEAAEAGHISVSSANIHRIIAASRGVVTVNSGVGAEALLQLKPVITTGLSDYAPATRQAKSIEDLYEAMDDIRRSVPDARDVRRFLWIYTKRYMVRYDDCEAIGDRLRELLALGMPVEAGRAADNEVGVIPEIEGATSIPLLHDKDDIARDAEGNLIVQDVALGEQCDQLLCELRAAGVKCWLDSGSLLGLVRYGRLNAWEKDIDLGIWIDDFETARAVCRAVADKFSLWYREKWVGNIPYALLLSTHAGQKQRMLPISVHTFYRLDGLAWLPQPYSLVGSRAKYPRHMYREINGPERASLHRKVKFLFCHPIYSLCIAMEKMGATPRIGRALKRIEKADSLLDRAFVRLFMKFFQWRIPAHYFDDLQEVHGDMPHVLVPDRVNDYLRDRYGNWRVPVKSWFYVVDDGCISPTEPSQLKTCLDAARWQYRRAAEKVSVYRPPDGEPLVRHAADTASAEVSEQKRATD